MILQDAVAYLVTLDPNLPWAALSLAVFGLIYLVRRYLPSLWLSFEGLVPGGLAYPDMTKLQAVWRKVWQTLPSVALGAVVPALASGGNVKLALYGAIAGAVAPLIHELAAALPFVPYQGRVGGPVSKRPDHDPPDDPPSDQKPVGLTTSAMATVLFVTAILAGCGVGGPAEAANEACAPEAAIAQARCLKVAFEKCGAYSEDPDACPRAAEVDAECDRFVREEIAQCN